VGSGNPEENDCMFTKPKETFCKNAVMMISCTLSLRGTVHRASNVV